MACIGVQAVTACGAANGHRFKPCGFEEYVARRGGDHRIPATHHTGESKRLDVVGDDEVFGIEGTFDSVEGLEAFAFARTADDDSAFDLVEVEGVGGLTHRE